MSFGFRPWVGDRFYAEGLSGTRLLLVGESHYVKPEWDYGVEQTHRTIADNAIGERRHPFFTKVVKLVLGIDANVESLRHDFWQRVAFYNYVQVKVGTDARERPSPEMWAAAKPLFQNLLASFKPDCVLVLGKAAWSNMPDPDKASNAPHEIKEYRGSFGQIVATYTHHPSSPRFTYAPFRARIAHLLVEGKMLAEKRMANGHLDCVN